MQEMKIDDTDIADFGARLVSFTVGGTKFTNNVSSNDNLITLPRLYSRTYQPRQLTVTLSIHGSGNDVFARMNAIQTQKSKLDKLILQDEVKISLPDGYLYRSVCLSIGDVIPDSDGTADVVYTFNSLQCLPMVEETISNGSYLVNNNGTAECDCIIEATNNTDVQQIVNFRHFGFKFNPLDPGKTLIINGFDGTLTIDGENVFNAFTNFVSFPRLPLGCMTFLTTCWSAATYALTITVKYYPTFL